MNKRAKRYLDKWQDAVSSDESLVFRNEAVIMSHGELVQYFYAKEEQGDLRPTDIIRLCSSFLIANLIKLDICPGCELEGLGLLVHQEMKCLHEQ